MEGGQTQQGPDAPPRWLQFAAWLRQQAGGPPDEALSEASASDAEEAAVAGEQPAVGPSPAAETSSSSTQRGNLAAVAGATGSSSSGAAAPPPPGHLARHTMLAPRLPDCRAEMRLTSDSANRARQEMTVMLAAPGMSLNEAPVLTAKQASALMSAICEPLLSLPVGRLTRKLAAPTKLQPTDDRGLLTLWLLPDDSLSLVWQSAQQLAPSALDAAAAASSSASASANAGNAPASSSSSSSSNPQMPAGLQQSCSVAVWEELAHFSSMAHLLEDAPVVTIHMLRGDASGRSFYIRVRDDVAEANLEAATAAVPDAKRLLQQQQQRASQATTPAAVEADSGGAPRMYFWLTDRDLGRAVYSLGRLKSLLKRPPTLAKRSGVPERQLLQLGAWLQSADVAAAAQQHQRDADAASASTSAAAAAAASLLELGGEEGESGQPAAAWVERQGGFSSGVAAAARARPAPTGPLSPLQQTSGLLLGHTMSQMHGGMAALLPPPPQQAQREREGAQSGAAGSFCSSGGSAEGEAVEAGPLASGTSTVSATAAALYQDQRFNVVCPCTVSVVVSMRMQAAGANLDPDLLPAEASARARIVAERHAKSAVDRSGRQRIEERLAEVVIRNIRAQRNRARHHRQQQRDGSARDAHRAAALALAQQATGRTPAPADTSASRQQDVPAAAVAEKVTPELEAGQPCSSSPFALAASSSAEAEAAAGSAAAAFGSPLRASGAQAAGSGRAFSSPAALPTPAALLPGGRVTLGNLQSLLNRPRLDTDSSLGSATSEQGAAAGRSPPVASGAGGRGGADHPSGRVSVADLAELLGKHAKLE